MAWCLFVEQTIEVCFFFFSWQDLNAQSSSSPVPRQDFQQQLLKGKKNGTKREKSECGVPSWVCRRGRNELKLVFVLSFHCLGGLGVRSALGRVRAALGKGFLVPGEGRAQIPSISGCSEPEPQCCGHIPSHLLLMQLPLQDQQKFIPLERQA